MRVLGFTAACLAAVAVVAAEVRSTFSGIRTQGSGAEGKSTSCPLAQAAESRSLKGGASRLARYVSMTGGVPQESQAVLRGSVADKAAGENGLVGAEFLAGIRAIISTDPQVSGGIARWHRRAPYLRWVLRSKPP